MFRCSDHDPVLVGLRLDSTAVVDTAVVISNWELVNGKSSNFVIRRALDIDEPSYYRVYTLQGLLLEQGEIVAEEQEVEKPNSKGVYLIIIYTKKETYPFKIIVP
jgi:hypothetical protein